MIQALKQFWNVWRGVLEREEMRWREQLNERPTEVEPPASCAPPTPAPSISDLVRQRQREAELNSASNGGANGNGQ